MTSFASVGLRRIALSFGVLGIVGGLSIDVLGQHDPQAGWAETESLQLSHPERWPYFESLLHSDLVIRGSVLSVVIKPELFGDVLPHWPSTVEEGTTTNVAHVRLSIDEVLRGTPPGDSVVFLVYVGKSHVRDNYENGQKMIVGLVWEADVLGGTYTLYDDAGRFVQTPDGWKQQSANLPLVGIESIERALATVAPGRVLADADAIVVGNLRRELLEYRFAPSGQEYALLTYVLSEIEVLKGDMVTPIPEIHAIASGEYWPAWRDNTTFPRGLKPGHRYCFFLRRADTGFALVAGESGVYEIFDGRLILPGRRSPVLTISEVKEAARRDE